MKNALLFTLFYCLFITKSHTQTNDTIHVSGKVFNASTMQFEPNVDIWVNESFKVTTNDTGLFEINLNRPNYFPASFGINLNVMNCDGWWKNFNVSLSSNFSNNFNDIILTICDSIPNTQINEPVTITPIGNGYFQVNTNAIYTGILINGEPAFIDFFDGSVIINDYDYGVLHVLLFDDQLNKLSDNFVPVEITEEQIPCNFNFEVYPQNTSDLGAYIYYYKKGDPLSDLTWTCNGVSIDGSSGFIQVPTAGSNEICMTASILNTCELQKCQTIDVLPAAELCNASFVVANDFGYSLNPSYTELNVGSLENPDSMIITVNGQTFKYEIIENRDIYLQKTTGNLVCLKVFRGGCSEETCQTINVPAQPAPSGCIVPLSLYFSGFSDNVLIAQTPSNIIANSFSWDFGDGNSSNDPRAIHTYTQSGTYIVTLTTVFNECTATSTDTVVIDLNSGCDDDFNVIKYSENRVTLWNNNAYFYLPDGGANLDWVANGDVIGSGKSLKHQFPTNDVYTICEDFNTPGLCEFDICKDVDLSTDTLTLHVTLEGFDPTSDFSDSKLVLYEYLTTMGPVPVPIDNDFQLGFVVRDTIDIGADSIASFTNLFRGFYGVKFIPGLALDDTTILQSYTQNQLLWEMTNIIFLNTSYYQSHVTIQKRTLSDNLGTGIVVGNVNYGPFRLSERSNPLENANLILFSKNEPVRFVPLNGNSTFQLSSLSNGAYTLMLDLPGYRTSTASFIISDENQLVNLDLKYDAIQFDDFTPSVNTSNNLIEKYESTILFPNPVNQQLFLSHIEDENSIKISDLNGKTCSFNEIKKSGEYIMLDVSNLQNGFYILTFTNAKGKKSFRKFIKN